MVYNYGYIGRTLYSSTAVVYVLQKYNATRKATIGVSRRI